VVTRSYSTGLSLGHLPRAERKTARLRLARIVEQLSSISTDFCAKYIDDTIEYFFGKLDPRISEPINLRETAKGKFGVNQIMTHLNEKYKNVENSPKFSANHLHSSIHLLSTATKGHYDRIKKLIEIFAWFKEHPQQMLQYLLWGRSIYLNYSFARYWKISFRWVDNFMFGVWQKYFSRNTLAEILPNVSKAEFLSHLDKLIVEVSAEEQTPGRKAFLNRLHYVKSNIDKLSLHKIPSKWRELKHWIAKQQLPKYKTSAWAGVVRSVISRVYVSRNEFDTLIENIQAAHVSDLLTIPFKQKLKKLPYLMVSGPKYVIKRKNNNEALEDMRKQGYFTLSFKELDNTWKNTLTVRVRASRKMRELLKYEELKLLSMIVLPPKGPAKDVDIRLIFSGPAEIFIATKHLNTKKKKKKRDQIGIDINRRGDYAVVSSFNLAIPDEIEKLNQRWTTVLDEIKYLQSLMDLSIKPQIYENILHLLHRRKIRLRTHYHLLLANFVGQQMVSANAQTLITEGLDVSSRGTKGSLAKAIESMPDDLGLYAREVYAVELHTGKKSKLRTELPYGSSKFHVGCGGLLKRDQKNYDIAPCKYCGKMVNTHHNAALYLEAKYLKYDPRDKNCLKALQLITPIGS